MLRTYDPHHPEWASDTTSQASEHERLAFGLLIETGSRATKQLCVFHTDDGGEQAGHRVMRHMIEELLSGSTLANRLLNTFAFLFLPLHSQQVARDGWSRFGWDCPPPGQDGPGDDDANGNANGITKTGQAVLRRAVENWLAEPNGGLFCEGAFHCDIPFIPKLHDPDDPASPAVSPYATVKFANGGVATFCDGEGGWSSTMWPEMVRRDAIAEDGIVYGIELNPAPPNQFYFEMPWRHAGHSAFFYYEDDAHKVYAQSLLAGIATVADAAIYFEGPAEVASVGTIAVSGYKVMASPVTVTAVGGIEVAGVRIPVGPVTISGEGVITVAGTKIAAGSTVITGGPFSVAGEKRGEGGTLVTGEGAIQIAGTTQAYAEGAIEVSGLGVIEVAGELVIVPPVEGGAEVSGVGRILLAGTKLARGPAAVSSVGSIFAAGRRILDTDPGDVTVIAIAPEVFLLALPDEAWELDITPGRWVLDITPEDWVHKL